MNFLRSPLGLALRTVSLIGLLSLSILFASNIIVGAGQSDQNVMLTVIGKSQKTIIDHERWGDYAKTHRFLTLQLNLSQAQAVGDIHEEMWYSIHNGDQVSATLWRGRVQEVSANGYSESIIDMQQWNQASARLVPWGILGLLCSALLPLQWKCRRSGLRSLSHF